MTVFYFVKNLRRMNLLILSVNKIIDWLQASAQLLSKSVSLFLLFVQFPWWEKWVLTRQVKLRNGESTLTTFFSNQKRRLRKGYFPSFPFLIGRVIPIYGQKMGGPNLLEIDIKMLFRHIFYRQKQAIIHWSLLENTKNNIQTS